MISLMVKRGSGIGGFFVVALCLALAVLGTLAGCSGGGSSLTVCSTDVDCPDGETCYFSQLCGLSPDGSSSCRKATGDRRCHRDCEAKASCGPDENCSEVMLFPPGKDVYRVAMLCL
jgi:hypothetical protein